jgi:GTP-binding protein
MLSLRSAHDNDALQIVVNSFLRSIDFIKGAVSMDTLPMEDCPEVAFIGRSNVGKSSLINAITNRKGLAFTSKTAGKTSEFNYFEVKGLVGAKKEEPRFYLIDLPGVGYAARSRDQRWGWKNLLDSFAQQRNTLKVIFHLVDSRHGMLDADYECLELLDTLPEHVTYVVVFTKVDKLRTSDNTVPIAEHILRSVQIKVKERTHRHVPILFTSSDTKYGALDVLLMILNKVA